MLKSSKVSKCFKISCDGFCSVIPRPPRADDRGIQRKDLDWPVNPPKAEDNDKH